MQDGFIYFRNYGRIKLLEIPKFGSITLKIQDGEIVSSVVSKTKQYKKRILTEKIRGIA